MTCSAHHHTEPIQAGSCARDAPRRARWTEGRGTQEGVRAAAPRRKEREIGKDGGLAGAVWRDVKQGCVMYISPRGGGSPCRSRRL